MRSTGRVLLLAVLITIPALNAAAEDGKGHFNLPWKTGGGKQFWADQLIFHDWRIQRNVVTGHHRLLDGRDVRQAWGTLGHCRKELEKIKKKKKLQPVTGKVVIVLHGILRGRESMNGVCRQIEKTGQYTVVNMTYPSSRQSIARHARDLDSVVAGLKDAKEINFVAHSLGNLVIRHYLADHTNAKTGEKPDGRIRRIVMIAPPNHGAQLAGRFQDNKLVSTVWGTPGRQIAKWDTLEPQLATPQCEFAIVAGGNKIGNGDNPLIDGPDDFVVSVEETKLVGARDFRVLPLFHNQVKDDRRVLNYITCFLQHGYFVSEATREPIEAPAAGNTAAKVVGKAK